MSTSASPSVVETSVTSEVPRAQRPSRPGPSSTQPSTQNIPDALKGSVPLKTTASSSNYLARDGRNVIGIKKSSLPAEKVFPIQVGSELFRLSGASICSDSPSYFTQFFEEQVRQNEETGGVRTLYIDRDPVTFRDIARHLQGYFIKPKDGTHFVRLFADAQFYSLPRLIAQLFEAEIFIQIGEKHFQIPKDVFSDPGNSPNFFSLGFAVFFSTPGEVFPGLDRRGLLRPPPINPPYVSSRSAEVFAQILHLLRGYPLKIRDDLHRAELLRDCRYFNLRGLEQRIIAHNISYNLAREKTEISLRLEDVKPSGISYQPNEVDSSEDSDSNADGGGWVVYSRPFVDESSYELIIEIGGESTIIDLDDMRADFHGITKARVASLFQVVANKMNLPAQEPLGLIMLSGGSSSSRSASPGHSPLSEDKVKIQFERSTDIVLDSKQHEVDWESIQGQRMRRLIPTIEGSEEISDQASSGARPTAVGTYPSSGEPTRKKRKRQHSQEGDDGTIRRNVWVVKTGQWRLRVVPNPNLRRDTKKGGYEIVFQAVKIDAFTNELARNVRRSFLD